VLRHGTGGDLFGIEACGSGAVNYKACVQGTKLSDQFFEEHTTLSVVQYAPLGTDTIDALSLRFPGSAACTRPELMGPAPVGNCQLRLVPVPILCKSPLVSSCRDGNGSYRVLGIATFGIASWQSGSPYEVRGWLLEDAQPPSRPLQRIGSSINPFAPILPVLIQ
jgi:hypothetical protein